MVYNTEVPKNTLAGVMELVDVVDSKSTASDSVQVRVWGARGALPVADEATRASGSGRQMPRSAVDAGRCRAPQQD